MAQFKIIADAASLNETSGLDDQSVVAALNIGQEGDYIIVFQYRPASVTPADNVLVFAPFGQSVGRWVAKPIMMRIEDVTGLQRKLGNGVTPPESSSDDGELGDRAFDENYLYICVGTNMWKRIPFDPSF